MAAAPALPELSGQLLDGMQKWQRMMLERWQWVCIGFAMGLPRTSNSCGCLESARDFNLNFALLWLENFIVEAANP